MHEKEMIILGRTIVFVSSYIPPKILFEVMLLKRQLSLLGSYFNSALVLKMI